MSKRERRFLTHEIRVDNEGPAPKIKGYGAVFNSLSEDLGGFREKINPGAFSETLSADVRALFNHDANIVLGRTTAGTLTLSEDSRGLAYEIDPPDTQAARDLMTSMKRGDINQSSFGFICQEDSWDYESTPPTRTILKASLFDVSPVTYPAYQDASSQVRSLFPDGKIDIPVEKREANDNGCNCPCDPCVADDCDNCSDPDCEDTNCLANRSKALSDLERRKMEMRIKLASL